MRKETVEKKDKDRRTVLNKIDVRIPETFEELTTWKLSSDATEMEKYIFGRKFEDWKKGVCVTIAAKIDNRKKGIDPEDKKTLDAIKNATSNIANVAKKILNGETLTKEELSMLTKKQS
jgi:hypothetical protein